MCCLVCSADILLNMATNNDSYSTRKYGVVSYDPNWIQRFEELKQKLQSLFVDARIEHIGSTSVPGMSGKECIDVLVIVNNIQGVEDHVAEMEELGFIYAGEFVMKDSRLFRIMEDNRLLANVHFFPVDHPHIREMLEMRDYLRSHPEEVDAYSKLKQELYAKYPDNYASYRKEKDEYMDKLKERVNARS